MEYIRKIDERELYGDDIGKVERRERKRPYTNREWLSNKYNEGLSAAQIASLAKCATETIYRWMRRLDVSARDRASLGDMYHARYADHIDLTSEAMEFIEGELLGDGSIVMQKQSGFYSHGTKYKEYLVWLSDVFARFGIKGYKIYSSVKSGHVVWHYHTKTNAELAALRERWYPNKRKRVPSDLQLTPVMLRQWYIGDGCLTHVTPPRHGLSSPTIAMMGFPKDNQIFLLEEIRRLGLKATIQKPGILAISAKSTKDFFEYIGPCPPEIEAVYGYKWEVRKA